MNRPKGVILYGIWGILLGIYYVARPLFAPYDYIYHRPFSLGEIIRSLVWGGMHIFVSVLLITDIEPGTTRHKEKPIAFLFFQFLTLLNAFLGIVGYVGAGKKIDFGILFGVLTLFIPASSFIYFSIPSVREYFRYYKPKV
ncbi:MAG: hypothetical protein HY350_00880 [Candidatus Omnitrophica bacterium]|nr:hypothetical protein [Candidatus Omnitrophota bacterium]